MQIRRGAEVVCAQHRMNLTAPIPRNKVQFQFKKALTRATYSPEKSYSK